MIKWYREVNYIWNIIFQKSGTILNFNSGTTFIHNTLKDVYKFECGSLIFSTVKIQSNATLFKSSRIRLDLSSITPSALDPALPKMIKDAEERNSKGIISQALDELVESTSNHVSENPKLYIIFGSVVIALLVIIFCLCRGRCPCQSGYR